MAKGKILTGVVSTQEGNLAKIFSDEEGQEFKVKRGNLKLQPGVRVEFRVSARRGILRPTNHPVKLL